jgi:hypothetical protein
VDPLSKAPQNPGTCQCPLINFLLNREPSQSFIYLAALSKQLRRSQNFKCFMKLPLLIIVGLFLLIPGTSQSQNVIYNIPSNQSEFIKQNKIVKEVVYNYHFKKHNIKDSTLFATYYYDTLGKVIEEKVEKTKINSETIRKYTYTYNTRGQLTRQKEERLPPFRMTSFLEYEYDSLGNEITEYDFNEDTTRLTIRHKNYYENNQVAELITKINHGEFYVSRQYFYNADNELIKQTALDPNGKIIYTYYYEYDKLLHKKTVYLENQEGKKRMEEIFYNKEQQVLKTNDISKKITSISIESTEYENLDKVTENVYNKDNTLFETVIYINGKRSQLHRRFYFKQ